MPSTREAGLRRVQGAVALARARLRGSRGVRTARTGVWIVTLVFAVLAAAARAEGGADASFGGLVASAARWLIWLGGAPLALAAAEDHAAADRRDGIVALAAARGVSTAGLASARVLAAMAEIASVIGIPLVLLALLDAALTGRAGVVFDRLVLVLGAAVFAIVAGVTLGALGAISGRIAGTRGRALLVALVVGPWLLADLAGHGAWSIPGALGAVLDFALRSGSA